MIKISVKELSASRNRLRRECRNIAASIAGHQDTLRQKQELLRTYEKLIRFFRSGRNRPSLKP